MENLLHNRTAQIELGCKDKCASYKCEHDSRCVQNFKDGSVRCSCQNDYIYSGKYCEISYYFSFLDF